MILNNKLRVSELDFASIKENLKSYLSTQTEFADYDYEASGMSILMDLLAYNTYYNSVMANYIANETYIDSAVKRDSVVSHAKSLGYIPKSIKSAKAKIGMVLQNALNNPAQLTMKAGTPFETTINENTYQFVTVDDVIAPLSGSTYDFGQFFIYEGKFQQNSYVAEGFKVEKFSLPNSEVDTTSIRVIVQESISSPNYAYYSLADSIIDVNSTSTVFFVQEGLNNLTEIYFGDDILGKQLSAGNIIHVTYVTSSGKVANGAKVFKLTGAIEGNSIVTIQTQEQAASGSDAENIESIRFNAMTYFGVQNRAVTADDCKALIMQNFNNVKNLVVWGGEKQIPPEYGKVIICIQPQNTEFLTDSEKAEVLDIIQKRAVANVSPRFLDPDYIDIEIDSKVYFDKFKNNKTNLELQNVVLDNIVEYADNYLGKFDDIFRFSLLSRIIDGSDYSILNNLTTFKMFKLFLPVIAQSNSMEFKFYNGITNVDSTGFYIDGLAEKVFLRNLNETIQLYYYNQDQTIKVVENSAGSVDLNSGIISIKPLIITNFDGNGIKIYATPIISDIFSKNNTIVRIQQENIKIGIYDDRTRNQ